MIIVDDREPEDIQSIGDLIKRLEYGDIVIESSDKKLVIERKTPTDLTQSLFNGRLNDQLAGCDALLVDMRKHGFNMAEYFRGMNNGPIPFINLLNGIATHTMIFYCLTLDQLKSMLNRFEDKINKGEFGKLRSIAPKSKLPVQVRILSQYPGVGIERAKILLKTYKSISAVEEAASITETIPGIGLKTVESINNTRFKKVSEDDLC